jgi:4'-phosphopantetheinyl transferase
MVTRQQSALWTLGNPCPFLDDGELHVWQARLTASEDELAEFARLLAPDENHRAARFHFERDRRAFVVGRGILRIILGRYLACAPEELAFLYGLHGKPSLRGGGLQFNMAHSDGLAVIAVTREGAVGIDVERVRPMQDCGRIMNSFFTAEEANAVSALPAEHHLRGFFTCWTRKEAYLKATGDGITAQLDHFSVPVVPGSPPRLLHVEGAPHEVTRWSFHELPLGVDCVGVVAFEGAIREIRHCLWCSP